MDTQYRPRWGVLGTGNIAAQFVTDAALQDGVYVWAVASRTDTTALLFAKRHRIPVAFGQYIDLVQDPDVDIVYIATPHTAHAECALLAIEHGKHVLIEKPFAVNAVEARRIVDAARANGTFAMEAMWTRFLPHIARARDMVERGELGDVRSLTADFGERFPRDLNSRAYNPDLAGGALLDLGIYTVSFASMLFGAPEKVVSTTNLTSTGVDAQTSVTLTYSGGRMAVLFTSIEAHSATRASINGTRARLEIDGDFLAPADMSLIEDGGRRRAISIAHEGRGLRHQAREVERCLSAGIAESPVMPLDESIAIMETLDEIRTQNGLTYPADFTESAYDRPR